MNIDEAIRLLPKQASDPRAVAILLFHILHKQLGSINEKLTPARARELIIEALMRIPAYELNEISFSDVELVPITLQADAIHIKIQSAVDALVIVWNEFFETREKKKINLNKKEV